MKNQMNNMDKVIWIINQYASHLETRHWELSRYFASQGYKVAVITTSYHHGKCEYMYDEKIKFVPKTDDIIYVYLHTEPSYSGNGARRVLNMMNFPGLVRKYHNLIEEKTGIPGFIIASSAPPFVWEAGYKISKKYNAKFIAEFRDIWPLSLVELQGTNAHHPFVTLLGIIEKRAYKRADAIVPTMPYAYKHVMEVADVPREKIHWMPNGINVAEVKQDLSSDLELPSDLKEYLSSHWCCVYIGSIAKSECLDYILKAFSRIKEPDIYFAVIGEGREKDNIMKIASELDIKNIRFFDAINKHLIPKALSLADAAVAAHENLPIYQYGLSMYKLNDYLVSGIPTVFACGADSIVNKSGHFAIPMGDEQLLADTILKIKNLSDEEISVLAEKAEALISEQYDYPAIGRKYLDMMESLLNKDVLR